MNLKTLTKWWRARSLVIMIVKIKRLIVIIVISTERRQLFPDRPPPRLARDRSCAIHIHRVPTRSSTPKLNLPLLGCRLKTFWAKHIKNGGHIRNYEFHVRTKVADIVRITQAKVPDQMVEGGANCSESWWILGPKSPRVASTDRKTAGLPGTS